MDHMPAASSSSPSFFSKHRSIFILAGIVIFILYVGLNAGIFFYSSQTGTNTNSKKQAETSTFVSGTKQNTNTTAISIPTSTPTLRPTGPGPNACSPVGSCKAYEDAVREAKCTVTYADSMCLDQCGNQSTWCKE